MTKRSKSLSFLFWSSIFLTNQCTEMNILHRELQNDSLVQGGICKTFRFCYGVWCVGRRPGLFRSTYITSSPNKEGRSSDTCALATQSPTTHQITISRTFARSEMICWRFKNWWSISPSYRNNRLSILGLASFYKWCTLAFRRADEKKKRGRNMWLW